MMSLACLQKVIPLKAGWMPFLSPLQPEWREKRLPVAAVTLDDINDVIFRTLRQLIFQALLAIFRDIQLSQLCGMQQQEIVADVLRNRNFMKWREWMRASEWLRLFTKQIKLILRDASFHSSEEWKFDNNNSSGKAHKAGEVVCNYWRFKLRLTNTKAFGLIWFRTGLLNTAIN